MFSKINIKLERFLLSYSLQLRIYLIGVFLTAMAFLPLSLYYLYNELDAHCVVEWQKIQSNVSKTENIAKEYATINEIPDSFFQGLLTSRDAITIYENGKKVLEKKPPLGEVRGYVKVSRLLIGYLVESHKEALEEIQKTHNVQVYFVNSELYAKYTHTFQNPISHANIRIDLTRNVNPTLLGPIESFKKSMNYFAVYFLVLIGIACAAFLKLAFVPLRKGLNQGFNEVIASHYQKRIKPVPKYGKEINEITLKVNSILDRMQEIVDGNIISMQDASHEINTQLTAMKQSVDMIRIYGDGDPQMVQKKMESINHGIKRTKQIITTVLELAKLNKGAIENRQKYCLVQLIEDFIEHQKRTHPDFHFDIVFNVEEPQICIKPEHFYLSLNPIIENAVRYSFSDSHKINIEVYEVWDKAHIAITNFGKEIERHDIPLLFERHFRGTNYKHKHGSGLGLHIVDEVVKLYNGHVHVESENGETTFTVAFPINCC